MKVFVVLFLFSSFLRAEELRIFSSNLGLFPTRIPFVGRYSLSHDERARKIANEVLALNPRPDVVAFQEMWSQEALTTVTQLFERRYPYKREDRSVGRHLVGVNSGLVIYSRYPITRSLLETYNDYRGDENFAKKGMMGVEILKSGKKIFLFTTHMQAGSGKIYKWLNKYWFGRLVNHWTDDTKATDEETRLRQLTQAHGAIKKFMGLSPYSAAFYTGDFNMSSNDPQDYSNIMSILENPRDTFCSDKSPNQGSIIGGEQVPRRIDFIFSLKQQLEGCSVILDTLTRGKDPLTDHLATWGEFQLP